MPIDQTLTPQNAFPLVGNLEDKGRICELANRMVAPLGNGLMDCAIGDDEEALLTAFQQRLSACQETSREGWALIKEHCLTLLGSPVANCVDHLCSALRTPAIAESALRSAGIALIEANKRKAEHDARSFMRSLFIEAIEEEEVLGPLVGDKGL